MTRPFLLKVQTSFHAKEQTIDITDIHLYPPDASYVFLVRYPDKNLRPYSPRRHTPEFIIRNIGIDGKIKEML